MTKDLQSRIVVLTTAIALLAGVLLLRFAFLDVALDNWVPVSMPLPGAMGVSDDFHLSSSGRFCIYIHTTARRNLIDPMTTVPIGLNVEISDARGFRLVQQITKMQVSSSSNETDTYGALQPLNLPSGGDYHIRITLNSTPDVFAGGRGVIKLERVAPSGYGLTYGLAEVVAYACFLYVLVQLVILVMRRRGTIQSR